jgi:hypothetical protein
MLLTSRQQAPPGSLATDRLWPAALLYRRALRRLPALQLFRVEGGATPDLTLLNYQRFFVDAIFIPVMLKTCLLA